jgi:transcriptional regulator NrdR family protein
MKFVCDCGPSRAFRCVDSRLSGDMVRRRYVCNHCYKRATTVEVVVAYDTSKPSTKTAIERIDAVRRLLFGEGE